MRGIAPLRGAVFAQRCQKGLEIGSCTACFFKNGVRFRWFQTDDQNVGHRYEMFSPVASYLLEQIRQNRILRMLYFHSMAFMARDSEIQILTNSNYGYHEMYSNNKDND